MPRDLGHTYVMVNIPDYTLRVVRDALIARLAEWQAWLGANMTAVFDGQQGGVDANHP